MLHEQISGYLDIKGNTNCLGSNILLLSSNFQVAGIVKGEIASQGWKDPGSCPGVSTSYISVSKLEAKKRGCLLVSVFQVSFILSREPV